MFTMTSVPRAMSAQSANPFEDVSALPATDATIAKSNDHSRLKDRREHEIGKEHIKKSTVEVPESLCVPIIDNLSPMPTHGSRASALVPKTTQPRADHEQLRQPIKWTGRDLYKLVYARFGEQVANDYFTFKSYRNLDECTKLVTLQFIVHKPATLLQGTRPPPGIKHPAAIVLATSKPCLTLAQAKRSIATDLLSCTATIRRSIRCNVLLGELYAQSEAELVSIRCAMLLMRYEVTDEEWSGRREQLHFAMNIESGDDDQMDWPMQARLELFLLEAGCHELNAWIQETETILEMGQEERRASARAFGSRARWLERALREF